MRARWIAAAAVAGALVALGLCAARGTPYEATLSVVVAPAQARAGSAGVLTRTAASLVRSRTVAENVVQALALDESAARLESQISVHVRPRTSIVDITVRQGTARDAERVAQQVLVVFQQLASSRLGRPAGGPAVATWDTPGGGARRVSRPYAGFALAGAAVGVLAAVALTARRPRPRPAAPPEPVPQPAREPEPVAEEPQPVAAPEAEPEPRAEPEPVPATGMLAELERRTVEEPDPQRREELAFYLEQLRPFAQPDGSLPANLIGLAEEMFGNL